jgi:hypothetical protein
VLFVFYGEPIATTQSPQIVDDVGETGELTKQTEPKEPVKAKPVKKKPVKQPSPKPKPAQVTPTYPVGCERYRPLVEQYDWNVNTAMAVMAAESGCDPNAANWNDNHGVCTGSFGLFQISCHGGRIHDPAKNVAAAWGKYQARGWWPWGVCTNGRVNCGI